MDKGADIEQWIDPLRCTETLKGLRVLLFSDGGLRRNLNQAAAGWVILGVVQGECWLIGRGATKLQADTVGSL